MNSEKANMKGTEDPKSSKASQAKRWAFLRRTPTFLNYFESPKILKLISPYIQKGDAAADIGSGWGYYTFKLADLVGPGGKVYSVELGDNCVRFIQKKAEKKGFRNIEAHASTAADLSFINDSSVDLVFANGLLCSMENDRASAVKEMKRILKPGGHAYISLGAAPPFGLVDETEWKEILSSFKVVKGGIFKELWAVVSRK